MRVEKRVLNDALRVLGKVVCQTSPVELYRSIRFVGDADGVMAMATDGVETVSVILDAFAETEIDFCVPFKELKDQVRMGRSETLDLTGTLAPAVDFRSLNQTARHKVFCRKAAIVPPPPLSFVPLLRFFQTAWCSVCKSIILRIAFVNIFVNILVLSLIIFNIFMTWL